MPAGRDHLLKYPLLGDPEITVCGATTFEEISVTPGGSPGLLRWWLKHVDQLDHVAHELIILRRNLKLKSRGTNQA